ncbi:hypothetical protein ACEPPN_007930 [Leptodophora sp. 'Broadleaf-Isolate-01']
MTKAKHNDESAERIARSRGENKFRLAKQSQLLERRSTTSPAVNNQEVRVQVEVEVEVEEMEVEAMGLGNAQTEIDLGDAAQRGNPA